MACSRPLQTMNVVLKIWGTAGLILGPALLPTTMSAQAKGTEVREEATLDDHKREGFPVTDQSRSQSAQARWSVEYKGGHLSVSAEQAPLAQVLREVARQTDIKVQGLERLDESISLRFANLSLHEGLQKLLASVNYLLIANTFPQREAQPTRLLVFGRWTASLPQTLLSGATSEEERENPTVNDQEREERLKALDSFAQQGNEAALQKALRDMDPLIQMKALEFLAGGNHQEATALLLDMTTSDQTSTRYQALQLLHEAGYADEETIVAALGAALTDRAVRDYAIQALAERGGADALNYLRQAYHDPDPAVRRLVIDNIAPQDQSLPLLQEAISDPDETIRSLAQFWLEQVTSEEEGDGESSSP